MPSFHWGVDPILYLPTLLIFSHQRTQGHSHFYAPWDYLICFKNSKSRTSWYRTSAELEIELHQRLHGTKSESPPLLFFDAPTMISYQVPHKTNEVIYCRKESIPSECKDEFHGINPKLVDPLYQTKAQKGITFGYAGQALSKVVYSPVVERHLVERHLRQMPRRMHPLFSG